MTMMMITFESLWFIFSVDFCIYCIQRITVFNLRLHHDDSSRYDNN